MTYAEKRHRRFLDLFFAFMGRDYVAPRDQLAAYFADMEAAEIASM